MRKTILFAGMLIALAQSAQAAPVACATTSVHVDAPQPGLADRILAHAAFDAAPCPFASCIVADEYVAYVMQVKSLPPRARAAFTRTDATVSRDDLSNMLLFMAPHRFAQKAWIHFSQRDDPCGFIGQITGGAVVLDRERF